MNIIEIVTGNILDSKEDMICHQVNCQGVMGAGVSKALYSKWPIVKSEYISYCQKQKSSKKLLGKYNIVQVEPEKFVANIFGQLDCGRDRSRVYTNYEALANAFSKIRANHFDKSIAFPYGFGCGLANGDWNIVYDMINTYFKGMKVRIYKLADN